ncbi:MAG: hypothetical protein IIY21_13835 [Clostridiales bacterium]|nr:hypothetical protein [Clostridiales bacterium]
MIKIETLPNRDIDCVFDGEPSRLFVEYNSATVGMIRKMREDGNKDKDIRDLLLGNVDIAFNILKTEGAVREVQHDKEKSHIINFDSGL